MLDAVQRGLAVPESRLAALSQGAALGSRPRFRARVNALKTVRDAAAARLDLDPGVLCARDRLEAVARKNPSPSRNSKIASSGAGSVRWGSVRKALSSADCVLSEAKESSYPYGKD